MSQLPPVEDMLEVFRQIEKDSASFKAPSMSMDNLEYYAEAISEIWSDETKNLPFSACMEKAQELIEFVSE